MIDLNEIAQGCLQVSELRIKNGSTIDKDVLKHCGGEIVEAVIAREKLKRIDKEKKPLCYKRLTQMYADEIVDICICALVAGASIGIDIEDSIKRKFAINEKRALGLGDKL